MARPRVFVSSTYYDLKYVRSSLEVFIESLGYDAVLSEKGAIAYVPDAPLDESCYREAENSDIYVLIIGGRYGSEISESRTLDEKTFFDRYESITKQEYKSAAARDVPIYVLVERSVYAEYHTYQKNRDNTKINYAHVDSANVFAFLEEIIGQPRNNPIQTFDRYSEIEEWLREQWAGHFRELLHRRSNQQQIATLAVQVSNLTEINTTLRRYLEEVIARVSPEHSAAIIRSESERLAEARTSAALEEHRFVRWLLRKGATIDLITSALKEGATVNEFVERLAQAGSMLPAEVASVEPLIHRNPGVFADVNVVRGMLGLSPFAAVDDETRGDGRAVPPSGSINSPVVGSEAALEDKSTLKSDRNGESRSSGPSLSLADTGNTPKSPRKARSTTVSQTPAQRRKSATGRKSANSGKLD